MADDEKVAIARLEERMKVQEAATQSIIARLWAVAAMIFAFVANQILGLIGTGGGQ